MTSSEQIIRVAARGDGVTADGRYVAHAAPGDMIEAFKIFPNPTLPKLDM